MDCSTAAHKITCGLQSVAEAINSPSAWDIAGVLIAGAAAAGTLWIARLNLKLMKAQREFDDERVREQRRLSRLRLATHLRHQHSSALLAHAKTKSSLLPKVTFQSQETVTLTVECDADHGDEFVRLLETEVDFAAHSHYKEKGRFDSVEALLAAKDDFELHLEMWIADPSKAIAELLRAEAERERKHEQFRRMIRPDGP